MSGEHPTYSGYDREDEPWEYDDEYPSINDEIEWDCTYCCGEGFVCGDEMGDPLYYHYDELYRCPACGGTGQRKDQTIF